MTGCCLMGLVPPVDADELVDLSSQQTLTMLLLNDCQVKKEVSPGGKETSVLLTFGHSQSWPHVRFVPERLAYPADWSRAAVLAVTLSNPTNDAVTANLRIDSRAETGRGRQGGVELAPGQRARLLMPLGTQPETIGMRGQPPLVHRRTSTDVTVSHNGVRLDASQITEFQLFLGQPKQVHRLRLHRIELESLGRSADLDSFVDCYGQYRGADWPGKVHSDQEFADRIRLENEDLKNHPFLESRDNFGGWGSGPQLEASGRFRVTSRDGAWWLVDPDGRLFWSHGVDCVRLNAATIVGDRASCFSWLPEPDEPMSRFYRGAGKRRGDDFFQANLARK